MTTTINLTDEDARLFLKFREHQNDFLLLYEAGVFNIKSGEAILNFNAEGVLTQVDLNVNSYRRGYPVIHSLTIGIGQ